MCTRPVCNPHSSSLQAMPLCFTFPRDGRGVVCLPLFRETVGREGDEGVDKATATRMRARFHENRNRGMEIEQAASSGPINECGFRGGSGSGTEINYS